MKILQLNFERGWRGGERQIIYTMQGLRKAGVETHLLCRKNSALEERALEEGFVVNGCKNIFAIIYFLVTRGSSYQFLHAHTSQILTWCVFTKFFHRSKVLFSRRVNFTQKGFFTRLKYRYTDIIAAVSEPVKEKLASFSGRKDIIVISDIVVKQEQDENRIKKLMESVLSKGKVVIGTTAALTSEKDPFTLIRAFEKFASKYNDVIFLHFGSGALKDEVEIKVSEAGLQHKYFLMGFEDDIESVFSMFDMFVISSKEEGLGSSVLDAFINRVPVVSTNAGGLRDLVQNDRGVLCNISDSECLASGMEKLLTQPGLRETFIDNAHQYVTSYHSQEFITKQYLQLFNNKSNKD